MMIAKMSLHCVLKFVKNGKKKRWIFLTKNDCLIEFSVSNISM